MPVVKEHKVFHCDCKKAINIANDSIFWPDILWLYYTKCSEVLEYRLPSDIFKLN